VCGRKLKVLLSALFLLLLPLVSSYSEVVLTDSEYNQLLTALETAREELNRQEKTIERQRETLSRQESLIKNLEGRIETQNRQLTKLEQKLIEVSKSLKEQRGAQIKSSIMWSSIGFAVGALGAGIVLSQ
jgi:septal ring factor EnvC (AmiA/AmiB activator)